MSSTYNGSCLAALQLYKYDFSLAGQTRTERLLNELSLITFKFPGKWRSYYHHLLFLLAYPANTIIYGLAEKEMIRLTHFLQKNKRISSQLYNSGLPQTALSGCFSYYLVKCLLQNDDNNIAQYSIDGGRSVLMQMINTTLSGVEKEMLSEEKLSWKKWIQLFAGTNPKEQLVYFIQQLEMTDTDISLRESIFETFKLNVTINPKNNSSSFLQTIGKGHLIHTHNKGLLKSIKTAVFIPVHTFVRIPVSFTTQNKLIQLAQRTIYSFFKETDPFTYARPEETSYFTCDRGISIALFYMHPQKKLELECYCGFLLLKNTIPVAYGGGWILGHQCRFGMNILPDFRGGESGIIAHRLMNLFVQHFNISTFIIEPFQLGKGNTEGIRSAAFWFYYKMGFRPMQPLLLKLAAAEFKKIKAIKGYRTTVVILKKLSESVMIMAKNDPAIYAINTISHVVTNYIKTKHGNNRELAKIQIANKYPALDKKLPFSILVLIDAAKKESRPTEKELIKLVDLYKLKEQQERRFVISLQRQQNFLRLLQQV